MKNCLSELCFVFSAGDRGQKFVCAVKQIIFLHTVVKRLDMIFLKEFFKVVKSK